MSYPPKSDTGNTPNGATHMVIELGYSCKLLLPIEEAGSFLQAYSRAREYKTEYKKPTRILPSPPEIKIQYVTEAQLAKLKFDDMLGLDDDD